VARRLKGVRAGRSGVGDLRFDTRFYEGRFPSGLGWPFANHRLLTFAKARSMKLNEKFNATIGGMLCVVGPIVALSIVATWALLSASEWKATEAIGTKIANEAAQDASDRQELSDLQAKVAEEEQNAVEQKAASEKEVADIESGEAESARQFKDRLTSARAKNKKLTEALTAVTADSISIKVPIGEARFIADKRVAVGVESVSVSFATVRIGDYGSIDMYPGESRAVQLGDKSFVVTLMRVEATGCVFAVRKS
jgi:hypothetical protein